MAPLTATAATASSSRWRLSRIHPGGMSTSPASTIRSTSNGSIPSASDGLTGTCGL
jgi:hypothetical protein